jgi:hypothetical protein
MEVVPFHTDRRTDMAKVIAGVITALGLGKLMVIYLVNKFITLHGKGEFVTVLKETRHWASF